MKRNRIHNSNLNDSIEKLNEAKKEILHLGMSTMHINQGDFLKSDFIVIGAVKRAQSTTSGLITMVNEKNMGCARALLRLHLDTILRFSAITLVDDIQDLASHMIAGKSLRKFKCRKGNKLFDGYLLENLKTDFPWMEEVYTKTSDYVHFSGSQIYDSVFNLNEDTRVMNIVISDKDDKYLEPSWIEIIDCSIHCLKILKILILYYNDQKKRLEAN